MKHSFLRVAPVALAAFLAITASAFAQNSAGQGQVCQKTLNGISICDVSQDLARQTASQLVKPQGAPAQTGEVLRYTEVSANVNEVTMHGRMMLDSATLSSNLAGAGKTLDRLRDDMDAAGRQSACAPGFRPFIQAGGALRMRLAFPDGSPFLDSVYDRC